MSDEQESFTTRVRRARSTRFYLGLLTAFMLGATGDDELMALFADERSPRVQPSTPAVVAASYVPYLESKERANQEAARYVAVVWDEDGDLDTLHIELAPIDDCHP